MEYNEAAKRAQELRKKIEAANREYYDMDNPSLEDYEYDALTRELKALEAEFAELKTAASPTQNVGGTASRLFAEVRHEVAMESLQDVFSFAELEDFYNRVKSALPQAQFVTERKIDGLSVSLEYRGGRLVRGSTRGNGKVGEDVTANIMAIEAIPKTLTGAPEFLEVRGEVYMPKSVFAQLVQAQTEAGEMPFKNPRNAAAGSLRQKDSKITAGRGLAIIVFNIQRIEGREIARHSEALDYLRELGFDSSRYTLSDDFAGIKAAVEQIGDTRRQQQFDLDGAVVKLDSLADREKLGSTAKFPRWAAAFKYPPEVKQSKLLDIVTDVGRTGVITPTAVFEPILLAGSSVARAVLHNQDFIDEKQLAIGDTVSVRKAGDIIPEIVGTEHCGAPVFRLPTHCPCCGSRLVKDPDGPAVRCLNSSCGAKRLRSLIHFCSKEAMDIDGMGPAVITALTDKELVSDFADLYSLRAEQLSELERMGDKSADNLIKAIAKSKENDLPRLICALGIRHIGVNAAALLAAHFGSMEAIAAAQTEEISAIDGFGDVMAACVREYFDDENNRAIIERLAAAGCNMVNHSAPASGGRLTGLTFVLTGALSAERSYYEQLIRQAGGKAAGSVSSKTSYVVAGEAAGSKLTKANQLGIPVLDEAGLIKMLEE